MIWHNSITRVEPREALDQVGKELGVVPRQFSKCFEHRVTCYHCQVHVQQLADEFVHGRPNLKENQRELEKFCTELITLRWMGLDSGGSQNSAAFSIAVRCKIWNCFGGTGGYWKPGARQSEVHPSCATSPQSLAVKHMNEWWKVVKLSHFGAHVGGAGAKEETPTALENGTQQVDLDVVEALEQQLHLLSENHDYWPSEAIVE